MENDFERILTLYIQRFGKISHKRTSLMALQWRPK